MLDGACSLKIKCADVFTGDSSSCPFPAGWRSAQIAQSNMERLRTLCASLLLVAVLSAVFGPMEGEGRDGRATM